MANLRKIIGVACIATMVVGFLMIPFVPTRISLGIAGGAAVLYFVLKALFPSPKYRTHDTTSTSTEARRSSGHDS